MRKADVVMQLVKAINAHDVEGIANVASVDHEFIDSLGGVLRGRDAVCAAWWAYFSFCPDYWVIVDEIIDGGSCVALFGTAGGNIVSRDGQGAPIGWRVTSAWRAVVKQGLVACWQVYADNKPVYDILARLQRDQDPAGVQ